MELLEAAIERVEARNALVNAVISRRYEYGERQSWPACRTGPFRACAVPA